MFALLKARPELKEVTIYAVPIMFAYSYCCYVKSLSKRMSKTNQAVFRQINATRVTLNDPITNNDTIIDVWIRKITIALILS